LTLVASSRVQRAHRLRREGSSRAFPKFESYGMLETAPSVGWKVKDAIVGFHGIGRLGCRPSPSPRPMQCAMCPVLSRRWRTGGVDPLLRLKHDNATGRNRRFLNCPRIAVLTLAFLTHNKRAKRRQLHRFATYKCARLTVLPGIGSTQYEVNAALLSQLLKKCANSPVVPTSGRLRRLSKSKAL
jgi:hypothetical protein